MTLPPNVPSTPAPRKPAPLSPAAGTVPPAGRAAQFEAVCAAYPALVAVYESRHGRVALLLRHTVVPLEEEHAEWLGETRQVARTVIAALRGAGLGRAFVVLQWRTLTEVAQVMRTWRCRYLGDHARHEEIATVLDRYVADWRFLRTRLSSVPAPTRRPTRGVCIPDGIASDRFRHAVFAWYREMAPSWLTAEPAARRELILVTHSWLWECVLRPTSLAQPRLDGGLPGLARALVHALPLARRATWAPWCQLALVDPTRALAWPVAKRDETWARWLFLIPYSLPVPARVARPDRGRRRRG
jgi:hypothetical protein